MHAAAREEPDDAALGAAFSARDAQAFERVYLRYGRRLLAIAANVLGERTAAEDAVHDALVRAWNAGSYRPERGALGAFLGACVRNEALANVRSAKRRAAREQRVNDPVIVVDPAEAIVVRAALVVLPPEQRDAIESAFYRGRTHVEIARETHVPLGTVKSRIALGMRRLAAELRPERTD
jgi:RNA polymerase sigma-70 factor (ECF subfamily)